MDELTIIASDQPERLAMAVNRHSHRVLALFEPLLDHQNILRQIVERRLGDWLRVALLDLRVLNAVRERAFARLERLPKRDPLHAWDDELARVTEGVADDQTLSVLLSIMLAGFPRATAANVDAFVAAALLAIGERKPSADIVAAAIVRIWRKNRLPPSIAEFIEECDEARQAATNARRVVAKMLALLDNAEEAIVADGGFDDASTAFRH
ncbi:hypothetical protein [Rhodoblastus sp.]|jgi:hypothetical protein|uniref:hypothetical protein n=1 Tax=Rhodoblastus sp. TaxID=1962975 RepID=UPI003F98B5F0